MAKVKELCQEKLGATIAELGYELVDVEYVKEFNGMSLIFTIDKEGGVEIDDCEKVSKTIDPMLDEINPTNDEPYTLIVSSPGLDRPLKTDKDLLKNIGKEVTVSLFSKVNGKKSFDGMLKSFDNDNIIIVVADSDLSIDRKKIANIKLVIKV